MLNKRRVVVLRVSLGAAAWGERDGAVTWTVWLASALPDGDIARSHSHLVGEECTGQGRCQSASKVISPLCSEFLESKNIPAEVGAF